MRSLGLLPACLLVSSQLGATTLVALWTPESVLLGADSRVVTDGAGLTEGCKIAHQGSTYFAVSGLVQDAASGFDVAPLMRASLSSPAAMGETVKRFLAAAEPGLVRALHVLKRDAPTDYKYLLSGKPVLQAIFAATEGGRPVLGLAGFQVDPLGVIRPHASVIDGSDARGPRLVYAGQQGRIREYLRTHPAWLRDDLPGTVRDLVQLEVNAGSAYVGGPVDVLELGSSGRARWIQKKAACGE